MGSKPDVVVGVFFLVVHLLACGRQAIPITPQPCLDEHCGNLGDKTGGDAEANGDTGAVNGDLFAGCKKPSDCPEPTSCHEAVCHQDGSCTEKAVPAQTDCDDQNHCSEDDVCDQEGNCSGDPITCGSLPEPRCEVDGTYVYYTDSGCNPTTGECFVRHEYECGTNQVECVHTCITVCEGVTCPAQQGGCQVGTCTPVLTGVPTYECVYTPIEDGEVCHFQNGGSGRCQGGYCVVCIEDTDCGLCYTCKPKQHICEINTDIVCRSAAGVCDVAETCNANGECPEDTFLSGVDCGAGPCMACSGDSPDCTGFPSHDASCPSFDCNERDTTCRDFYPYTGWTCSGHGTCHHEMSACVFDANTGTACGDTLDCDNKVHSLADHKCYARADFRATCNSHGNCPDKTCAAAPRGAKIAECDSGCLPTNHICTAGRLVSNVTIASLCKTSGEACGDQNLCQMYTCGSGGCSLKCHNVKSMTCNDTGDCVETHAGSCAPGIGCEPGSGCLMEQCSEPGDCMPPAFDCDGGQCSCDPPPP